MSPDTDRQQPSDLDRNVFSEAEVHKIDAYILHELMDPQKFFSYSGSTEGLVKEALERQAFLLVPIPFLIRLTDDETVWPKKDIEGLQISSRLGCILAARGTIHTILALCRDEDVISMGR